MTQKAEYDLCYYYQDPVSGWKKSKNIIFILTNVSKYYIHSLQFKKY